jgi:hypothetical protein
VDVFHDPDRATLVLDVMPGTRAKILEVKVTQVDATERATITDLPNIRAGQIYDEVVIGRELQEWENRMRSRGYYEARAIQNSSISGDGSVFVFLNLELGPQVRLVFEGDPIPDDERDKLVPVRTEASADEDLLEDSQSAIESYFRARGLSRRCRAVHAPGARRRADHHLQDHPRAALPRRPYHTERQRHTPDPRAQVVDPSQGRRAVRAGDPDDGCGRDRESISRHGLHPRAGQGADAIVAVGDRVDPDRLVNVAIAIVEGPRTEVRSVTFQGNMALTDADLRKVISTAPGRVYSAGEVIADRDEIVQLIQKPRVRQRHRHAAARLRRERYAG